MEYKCTCHACYPLNPLIYNLEPSNGVCSAKLSVCTLLLNKPARTGCALNLFGVGAHGHHGGNSGFKPCATVWKVLIGG